MRVLLTGASGFIGRHLVAALAQHGYTVVCATRHPLATSPHTCAEWVEADFGRDTAPRSWVPRLAGVDVVINAVGILREAKGQSFAALHVQAPCALFDACVEAGVERVINISALGADAQARSAYHLSKRRADEHLSSLPLSWTIVQPSLVYGADGESARLFTTMASLPFIPLPDGGNQQVQPLHIDDLTAGVLALMRDPQSSRRIIPFVGPLALSLRQFLAELRSSMQLDRGRFVSVPLPLVRIAASLGDRLPGNLLDSETLGMLLRGNVGDASPLRAVLGQEPRCPSEFVSVADAAAVRTAATLPWSLAILRFSIAAVWIVTGVVSLGLFPTQASYELLSRSGVPVTLQPVALYGAAMLDFLLGIATLLMRRRQGLYIAQIVLILLYTAIITVRLPEFWLHPYGPLLKNVPMLAALMLLCLLERRR